MIPPDLLQKIRCPETRQPLAIADAETLAELNQKIGAGTVRNRAGQPIQAPVSSGLIREDKQVLYPIHNSIPALLPDQAILLK